MKKLSIIFLLILISLSGCINNPDKSGTIILNLSSPELQALLPDINMIINSYDILGTGPDGASFEITNITETFLIKDKLALGEWVITVNGKNVDGVLIGQGQTFTTVLANQTTDVNIVVRPLEGLGTLDLTVNWNATDIQLPTIDSSLVLPNGDLQPLNFTITNNTATYYNNAIQSGYYSLIVKLMDTDALTMGVVEVVRIAKDGVTSGIYNFSDINKSTGSIMFNITPEMGDPINVTLSGQEDQILTGESMTVSASVPEDVSSATFVWYLNGESQSVGDTFTVRGLDKGVYRLDVTVFTTDGSRTGSATHNFTVSEFSDQQITFIDPCLENVVRHHIGNLSNPIYLSEVINLTELDGSGESISNLSGLEYFSNLENLILYSNQIGDLTPLTNLTNLRTLNLEFNQISDLTPLAQLNPLYSQKNK